MKDSPRAEDFEKDYENKVIIPVNKDQSAKHGRYVLWRLDIADIFLLIAMGVFIAASIILGINIHNAPKAISEWKIIFFFISLLFIVAAMISQYIYTTYVVYNRNYYRECQSLRLEKAEPLLDKWGYRSIESLQALAQRYQNDRDEAKGVSSGKWELFFLLSNSILAVTSMMWNDQMTEYLGNPLFSAFIVSLFVVPVVVSLVRKICYDFLWQNTRQYILSDVLVIIENRLRFK